MSDSWHCAKKPVFAAALWKKLDKKHKKVRENGAGKKMFLLCSRWLDHHLTTLSSQPVPCIVFTLQHSFITTTTSAGSCAHYTISGAGSCYLPARHSSPTRKAAGSNPVSRTKKDRCGFHTAVFLLFLIARYSAVANVNEARKAL